MDTLRKVEGDAFVFNQIFAAEMWEEILICYPPYLIRWTCLYSTLDGIMVT